MLEDEVKYVMIERQQHSHPLTFKTVMQSVPAAKVR